MWNALTQHCKRANYVLKLVYSSPCTESGELHKYEQYGWRLTEENTVEVVWEQDQDPEATSNDDDTQSPEDLDSDSDCDREDSDSEVQDDLQNQLTLYDNDSDCENTQELCYDSDSDFEV